MAHADISSPLLDGATRVSLGKHTDLYLLAVDPTDRREAAVAYLRLSVATGGNEMNLSEQLRQCVGYAELEGAVVVAIVVEYGERAFDTEDDDDARPGFVHMMAMLTDDSPDAIKPKVVVALNQDRMLRSSMQTAMFVRTCEKRGIRTRTSTGAIDFASAQDRFIAGILGLIGELESAIKRERSLGKHRALALAGKLATKGGHRPFGFEADFVTPKADEVTALNASIDDLLNGTSMREVVRKLNADGMLTPAGNEWAPSSFRNMLRRKRLVGIRSHGSDEFEAAWPAIVDLGKFELVQTLLDDPSRRTNERQRRYALSGGLLVCGECGAKLISRPIKGEPRYICPKDRGGCGGVTVLAKHVEARAEELVRTFLVEGAQPGVARFSVVRDGDELAAAEAKKARIEDAFADGTMSKDAYARQTAKVDAELAKLRARIVRANVPEWVKRPGVTAEKWPELDAITRRSVMQTCVEHFVIERRERGGTFDISRVRPVWKLETATEADVAQSA